MGWRYSLSRPCKALKDRDAELRAQVARALGSLAPNDPAAVKSLVHALKDEDAKVRLEAAEVLAELGPDAKPALGTLVETLGDDNAEVRDWAALALGSLGVPAAPSLFDALGSVQERVRVAAAHAISQIGMAGFEAEAVPQLTKLLNHKKKARASRSSAGWGQLGQAAQPAAVPLVKALKDSAVEVRQAAALALGQVGDCGAKVTQALELLTKDACRRQPRRRTRRWGNWAPGEPAAAALLAGSPATDPLAGRASDGPVSRTRQRRMLRRSVASASG